MLLLPGQSQLAASHCPRAVPGEPRAAGRQHQGKFKTLDMSQADVLELPAAKEHCVLLPVPAASIPSALQVAGERYVYKFVCEPEALFSLAFPDNQRPALKAELDRQVSEEDTVPLSHLDESAAYLPDLGSLPAQLYSKGYTY